MSQPSSHEHDEYPESNPSVAFDPGEEDVKAVSSFGSGLALGIVVVAFAMWGLFEWFYAREDMASAPVTPAVLSEKPQLPPEPRLQAVPKLDLKALRESEEQVLTSSAWVDPNHGIARIAIADAIKIVAAKGLPSKPSADLPNPEGYRELPSVASSARTGQKISQ